jgi:ketosteroid isomerase-like protein
MAWLTTFRDGKIVLARGYLDVQEALEAAGCGSSALDEKQ